MNLFSSSTKSPPFSMVCRMLSRVVLLQIWCSSNIKALLSVTKAGENERRGLIAQFLLSVTANVKIWILTEDGHRGGVGEFTQAGGSDGTNSIFSSFSVLLLLVVRPQPYVPPSSKERLDLGSGVGLGRKGAFGPCWCEAVCCL